MLLLLQVQSGAIPNETVRNLGAYEKVRFEAQEAGKQTAGNTSSNEKAKPQKKTFSRKCSAAC